jgi:hypothetical protein
VLSIINRLMTSRAHAMDVVQPTMSGRMIVRYALGMGLRLWGDGILNRAAELEREQVYEDTDRLRGERHTAFAELAAARAELAHLTKEIEQHRPTPAVVEPLPAVEPDAQPSYVAAPAGDAP